MLIAKAPYRVSFLGGGSDVVGHYSRHGGAVVSCAIDRYLHITANRTIFSGLRIAYQRIENVSSIDEIQHDIVREALRQSGFLSGLEITMIGDLPAGSGLASSSALAVALAHLLHRLKGTALSPEEAARWACVLEIDKLRHPIGKQDQYASAYGGLNLIRFHKDHSVHVEAICLNETCRSALEQSCRLFFTGEARQAHEILRAQSSGLKDNEGMLREMSDLALHFADLLNRQSTPDVLGAVISEGWNLKRSLHASVSTPVIDRWFDIAEECGAWGAKLLGAGGGGGFLVMAAPDTLDQIHEALGNPPQLNLKIVPSGAMVVEV